LLPMNRNQQSGDIKEDQTKGEKIRERSVTLPHCHFPSIYPAQNPLGAL
jgi:hypothetical protein